MQGTPTLPELKLQYYRLLIRFHAHNNEYLEVCRCYKAIYEDTQIASDPSAWQPILRKICWCANLNTKPYTLSSASAGEFWAF